MELFNEIMIKVKIYFYFMVFILLIIVTFSILKGECEKHYDNLLENNFFLEQKTLYSNNRAKFESNIMTYEELSSFYNAPVDIDNEVENAFYFKNHIMKEEYNIVGTCSIVTLGYLLGYYDTFYNGNLVPNTILNNSTENNVSEILPLYNSLYTNNINFKSWKSFGSLNPPSPTIDFHNYLFDLAVTYNLIDLYEVLNDDGSVNIMSDGMSATATNILLQKYFEINNISNDLLTFYNPIYINENDILDLLDQDIPLQVSIEDYDYYCLDSEVPIGYKTSNSCHSILVYGYIKNEYGTFLKADFGYANMTNCFVNINHVTNFSYYLPTSEHVCSNNYHFLYEDTYEVIDICPCHQLDYYFTHLGIFNDINNNEFHKFQYNFNTDIIIKQAHILNKFSNQNEVNHTTYCDFYDFCQFSIIASHNYKLGQEYRFIKELNIYGHYKYCLGCNFLNFYAHDSFYENNGFNHSLICRTCMMEEDFEHNFGFSGTYDNHFKFCEKCDYEFLGDHNITYESYNEINHSLSCTCDYYELITHNYSTDLVCVDCGQVHSCHYFLKCIKKNNISHIKRCLCGYELTENHAFVDKGIGSICSLCGYLTSSPVIVFKQTKNNVCTFSNYFYDYATINYHFIKEEEEKYNEI